MYFLPFCSVKYRGSRKNHIIFVSQLSRNITGDQFGPGWMFFPAVCFGDRLEASLQSQHCIDMYTDIKQWLSGVLSKFPEMTNPESPLTHPMERLKTVLQMMLFVLHVSKPITASNWFDYINNAIKVVSSRDNIVFYSKNQLPVFMNDDQRYNKLVITGGYSTGKSFLLKQKALMLNKDPEYHGRVMYMCSLHMTMLKETLFHWSVKHELEPKGIIVGHPGLVSFSF